MDGRGQKFRRRGSELVTHIAVTTAQLLVQRAGMKPEVAEEVARDHAHDLAAKMGGQIFYLAKDISYPLSKRDARIVASFRGDNYDALAREHGLTVVRVRQIIDQHRREQLAARQGALFGSDQPRSA